MGQAEAAGCPHPAPLPPAPSPPGSPSDLFVFPLKGGSPALCGQDMGMGRMGRRCLRGLCLDFQLLTQTLTMKAKAKRGSDKVAD